MLKTQILRAMLVYFLLLVVSVVFSACCDERELRIADNGSLSVFDSDATSSNPGSKAEVVDEPFILKAEFLVEDLAFLQGQGIVEGAYATSCPEYYLNQFVQESLIVTLNDDFILADETIPAGTNLIDLEFVEPQFGLGYGVVIIDFPEAFVAEANFEDQPYTFSTNIRTDDNEQLSNEVTVDMDISN